MPRDAFDDSTESLEPVGPSPIAVDVRVEGATARPRVFRLTRGACVIGAGAECDIVVEDAAVSRSHLRLELSPHGVAARDLGSRNGTFYLGQRIEGAILTPGCRLVIGRASVVIDAAPDAMVGLPTYTGAAYEGILGESVAMRRLFSQLLRLEGALVPVLVHGESGVGKELVARAIHARSKVASGPLVAINCGALARDLIASELFGHHKGAFTSAASSRKGAFEAAHGGTIFLDEIGELPLDVQPSLLRVLETGEVRPVGADSARVVRARLVTATNRDLEEEVRAGRFREDLYYRLAVVKLTVPPLRERPEDIEPIARSIASNIGLELPREVLERLKMRPWPGNGRELRNAVLAYAALGELPDERKTTRASRLEVSLFEALDPTKPYAEQKEALVDRFTQVYLRALMAHTRGNQSAAARVAELDRTYLGRLLVKHGIDKE